jgi:NADPH-dependent 2,4-dienoyl-CoA reductase/sulfur reductase-like enzyme
VAQPGRIVIVGGSLAGLRAAETLRQEGYGGTITLIGAEPHLPYDRPPLSKKLLAGQWEPDRIHLRRPDDVVSLALDLRLGVVATRLDVDQRTVELDDSSHVGFDGLVIATGARPRRLPGQFDTRPRGTHELRTLDDSLALRAAFGGGDRRVVVIGAGFIGLEVAATARGAGCDVTVLEAADAPLVRALGAEMGRAVAAVHDDEGVPIRCGVAVAGLEPDGVRLGDGELVAADEVVVGIGVAPATGWLEGSGLTLRDGVVCDETLATGVAGVYAAGDVVRWPNPLFGEEMRIEHWTNAAEQGAAAGANLLAELSGRDRVPYAPVPFFWSDQYRHRVQFLGRAFADGAPGPAADERVEIVVGSPAARRFLALYGRAGRLRGALALNAPRLVMPYRKLLADRATWDDGLRFGEQQQAAQ